MVYGYIRVSSDKQTIENQRFEITNFCEKKGLLIDDWIEETISGTKSYNKRQLGKLLKKVGKEDIIICSELSRLGRNLFMIMEILNICTQKKIIAKKLKISKTTFYRYLVYTDLYTPVNCQQEGWKEYRIYH